MSVETPRRIVLLRHAKADWPDVADLDRPLADRGRREAPQAGRQLATSGAHPELTLCSTATRTRETWKLLVPELPERPRTVYDRRIYEASPGELIALLNDVDDAVREVLLIGHNPGIHGLAGVLTEREENGARARMDREGFPPAAFARLTVAGGWAGVEPGTATLTDYWSPRM